MSDEERCPCGQTIAECDAEEIAHLNAEITRLESLASAPRECPTNHMWLNHNVPGAAEWEPWAVKGYAFCPDCGTPLSAGREE